MGWLRLPIAFVLSVALMAALGVIVQTQFVLSALKTTGAPVEAGDRIAMTGADLIGLGPLYAALIAIGFLIAFLAAGLVLRVIALPRVLVFAAAGAVCIAVMLVLMREVFFGVPVIAGARTLAGQAGQAACGALAGAAFALLTRSRAPKS
jgi:hypothetical protein